MLVKVMVLSLHFHSPYSQVLSKQLTVWLVKFVFVGGEGGARSKEVREQGLVIILSSAGFVGA